MREDCLDLLAKLDKCMADPDFQIIVLMKFLKNLAPYLQPIEESDKSERNNSK